MSGRKPEASIMFSLEELMKANSAQTQDKQDEAPDQLWSMQSATPLFGTEYDQALLTTPLKRELTSMESMTVPSRRPPTVRRLVPLVIAIAGGSAALAGAGWWAFGPTESEAKPTAEVAVIEPSAPTPEPAGEAAPAPSSAPAPSAPVEAAPAPAAPETAPSTNPVEAAEAALAEAAVAEAPAPEARKSGKKTSRSKRTATARTTPAAAPTSAKAPFNTAAARDALSAAASRAAGCKGTSGTGKIQLTFATSGKVSSAQLVAGPFAGTTAGKCALRNFKAARVPAFTGSPTTVSKSFKIQ
jgi:outer membrane biosynthesis protein TonB